jgi:hypothetical protein
MLGHAATEGAAETVGTPLPDLLDANACALSRASLNMKSPGGKPTRNLTTSGPSSLVAVVRVAETPISVWLFGQTAEGRQTTPEHYKSVTAFA